MLVPMLSRTSALRFLVVLLFSTALRAQTADEDIRLGDYHGAIAKALDAQKIHHASGDIRAENEDLYDIGLANLYLGNYDLAADTFVRVLKFDRLTGDSEGEVIRIKDLGNARFFQARYADAAKNYESARSIVEANPTATWHNRALALVLANQAVLCQRLGQYEEALAIYSQFPRSLTRSEQARMLTNKGTLFRRLGDPYRAMELYQQAEILFQQDHDSDGELGTIKNRGIVQALDLGRPKEATVVFGSALRLALSTSNRREVLQAQLYRAEAFRLLGQPSESRADAERALQLATELKSPEDEWRALFVLGQLSSLSSLSFYQRAIHVIEGERERLEFPSLRREFLAGKREVYDATIAKMLDGPVSELFAVMESSRSRGAQDSLPTVSLNAVQQSLDRSTGLLETWSSRQGSAAIFITGDRAAVLRGGATADLVRALPLETSRIDKLFVVVDGTFRPPFEPVTLPDGRMLIQKVAVSYLPTAAYLLLQRPIRKWRFPWEASVLGLAVPEGGPGLPALAHAEEEVRFAAASLGGRSRVEIGDGARGSLLQFPQFPVIHLAAHAVASSTGAEHSRLILGDGSTYLRALSNWNLNTVDLITLSACDTENGRQMEGEGVENFSRVLLAAGAGSTITTLWPVSDEATAHFMKQFYFRLARSRSKAQALQEAKLRFIQSRGGLSDPHYWAGYIISGDGFSLPPRFLSWSDLEFGAGALIITFVSLFRFRRRNR